MQRYKYFKVLYGYVKKRELKKLYAAKPPEKDGSALLDNEGLQFSGLMPAFGAGGGCSTHPNPITQIIENYLNLNIIYIFGRVAKR